jgi:hypothetical protein
MARAPPDANGEDEMSGNHAAATTTANVPIPRPGKERVQMPLNLKRPAPTGAACAAPSGENDKQGYKKIRRNVDPARTPPPKKTVICPVGVACRVSASRLARQTHPFSGKEV